MRLASSFFEADRVDQVDYVLEIVQVQFLTSSCSRNFVVELLNWVVATVWQIENSVSTLDSVDFDSFSPQKQYAFPPVDRHGVRNPVFVHEFLSVFGSVGHHVPDHHHYFNGCFRPSLRVEFVQNIFVVLFCGELVPVRTVTFFYVLDEIDDCLFVTREILDIAGISVIIVRMGNNANLYVIQL